MGCKIEPQVEINTDNDSVKVYFPDRDSQLFPKPLKLSDLLQHKSLKSPDIIGLIINGSVYSLNSTISFGLAKVFPITLKSDEGLAMYRRTLVKILATAVNKLYSKDFTITINHNVNNGYLVKKMDEKPFTEEEVTKIKEKMTEYIQQDLPLDECELSHNEAVNYFTSIKHYYSVALIEGNNSDSFKCSCLDKCLSLLFRPLAKSTGIIKDFDVRLSSDKNSLLLLFPTKTKSIPDKLEEIENKLIMKNYSDSFNYSKVINIKCVGDWNKIVVSEPQKVRDLIITMNSHQESEISSIADKIADKVINGKVKFIGIAGPSASGKTTFSKKLGLLLLAQGIETIVISMDDYFVNRKDTPKDKKGNYDFECLEALRIDDFNRDLNKLFNGEEINRCVFDFIKGTYSYKKDEILKLPNKESGRMGVVLCEGLHGIDERVTNTIPRDQKFFIYIAPLTPIHSDEYNFVADYVLRLYRRMIRDFRTRARSASDTLKNWPGVAQGEEKYIFPFIDSADLIWNSSLEYEVSILYPFVYPLLRTVDVKDPNYYLASYLLDTMAFYLPISDSGIEKPALIREFIGGSSFE